MSSLIDTWSDKKIKVCIRNNRSFSVIAGAGSGKTTSLVKALNYVRETNGHKLRVSGQRIACITFTNRAVEVIKNRVNSDDLFLVSTLHGFLWSEIKLFYSDIRKSLKEVLIPRQIKKKQEDDNGGQSIKAKAARKKIAELQYALSILDTVPKFGYDESGNSNYSKGQLDHDDVIDLAADLIQNLPILRKIIGQKFPYIFVDEAQDTFPEIIKSLNMIAKEICPHVVGYFGDPMQQIYEGRAGNFGGPEESIVITKKENYRCSIEVIKLLNLLRADVQQKPAGKNVQGSVHIRLIRAQEGLGPRKTYSEEQLLSVSSQFQKALSDFGWDDDGSVKKLFLARQMIARRLGFSNLNQLFTGEYASRNAQESYESGENFLTLPLTKILVPMVESYIEKNHHRLFKILRENSPLLDPNGENRHLSIAEISIVAENAIKSVADAWTTQSIGEILKLASDKKLIPVTERLKEQLSRPKRTEEYNEELHSKDKGDWLVDSFFSQKTTELSAYTKFLNTESPFSTQHGVKGEEYEKVLVLYDDTEANWNVYSFSKLLVPTTSGKDPTEGQKLKSQKLSYVSFSRAEKDLKIILFTLNPEAARSELIKKNLFREDQISIQDI